MSDILLHLERYIQIDHDSIGPHYLKLKLLFLPTQVRENECQLTKNIGIDNCTHEDAEACHKRLKTILWSYVGTQEDQN